MIYLCKNSFRQRHLMKVIPVQLKSLLNDTFLDLPEVSRLSLASDCCRYLDTSKH